MPYTEEFSKLRRRVFNQYADKAKAETFAYEKAFKLRIPTFTERKNMIKIAKKGQGVVAGFLYFFMAMVCVAVFMPAVRDSITSGIGNISSNVTNYSFIVMLIRFWPLYFGVMILIIFIVILTVRK
jgi:hypothetical protein